MTDKEQDIDCWMLWDPVSNNAIGHTEDEDEVDSWKKEFPDCIIMAYDQEGNLIFEESG